jgi:hypothetical protein
MEKALSLIVDKLQLQEELNGASDTEKMALLTSYLNDLVLHNFNHLVSILYRIDVSEQKVRLALAQNPQNKTAGEIIAQLLLEREAQKIEFRKNIKTN